MPSVEVPEGVTVFPVSVLTDVVKTLLEDTLDMVWVEGEISNLAQPSSGHLYLTLKDAGATLKAVAYRGVRMRFAFDPKDGMEVIAFGRISVYKPRGEYQLLIEKLIPKGIGALEQALQRLKEQLLTRGYFDPHRKRPLPRYPQRIALVASPTGAAIRDMLQILRERWPSAEVIICGVRVQGVGAAEEIAAALEQLNQVHAAGTLSIDFVILGRGGGSLEDLWAFNEELTATAIYKSNMPVVSAIGHEIDVSIADLVADVRAATPSHAIEASTPDRQEQLAELERYQQRLREALRRRLKHARERLDFLSQRRSIRLPFERIQEWSRRLDELSERLHRAMDQRHAREKQRLASLTQRLETLSPLNVLSRGYTLTHTENRDGLIHSIQQVQPGQIIRTTVSNGEIVSAVVRIDAQYLAIPPTEVKEDTALETGSDHEVGDS